MSCQSIRNLALCNFQNDDETNDVKISNTKHQITNETAHCVFLYALFAKRNITACETKTMTRAPLDK